MSPQQYRLINQIFQNALDLPPAHRAAYLDEACNGDAELREEVEELLRADEQASARIDRAVNQAEDELRFAGQAVVIGRHVGPYKIVREIGRGGMGAVYEAVRTDDQYVRSVAIKFVALGMDTPESLARFRVERQVLASLQHPNIAMLLDGGTSEDGRPYIVMEYVKGQPLLDYCQQHDLPVAERLKLFCSLCSAVHHAHQMLVIHRDIKPANVLVTEAGEPKLLDFGIAKLLSPDLTHGELPETLTLHRRLTPRYASPEQIRGEPLTTASDVYSLGVLLYELLTYASPYQTTGHSHAEVQRAVCEQEPARLSRAVADNPRLKRELSGDLDNIVSMALRKEPQRRYSSAQQLAEDIRRYLNGLPVTARDETIFYLAAKLVRRNKLASAALALLAISVFAGWSLTIHEARKTQARFEQVRSLANTLLSDIPRDLRGLPGSVPIRAKLVRTALEHLNTLSQDAGGDVGFEYDLAQAYDRVGDVQGDPDGPNLGQYSDAIRSYQSALALGQRVIARRGDPGVFNTVAWLHLKIGDLQWRTGNSTAAFENYRKGLEIAARMRAEAGDMRGFNVEREGYQKIARAYTAARRLDEALTNAQAAKEAAVRFAPSTIGRERGSSGIAAALMIYGDVLGVMGNIQESRKAYEEAVTRLEPAVRAQPDQWADVEDLADAYRRLGDVLGAPIYFNFGESHQAEVYLAKALVLEQRMADHEPQSAQRQARLSMAFRRLGSVQREHDPAAAAASYERAIEIAEELRRGNPSDLNYQRELAIHRQVYGQALHRLGRLPAAQQQIETAIGVQRRLVEQLPNRTVLHEDLFHSLLALGDLKPPQAAIPHYDEAAVIARRLRLKDEKNLYAERCAALAQEAIGSAQARLRDRKAAEKSYRDALEVWTRWRTQGIAIPFSVRRERETARALASLRG